MTTPTFETKLKKLEKIVADLESEKTSLDSSAALFEQGITLAKELSNSLKDIRFKVSTLKEENKELFTETLNEDAD